MLECDCVLTIYSTHCLHEAAVVVTLPQQVTVEGLHVFASVNFDCAIPIPCMSRVTACCFGALSIEKKPRDWPCNQRFHER